MSNSGSVEASNLHWDPKIHFQSSPISAHCMKNSEKHPKLPPSKSEKLNEKFVKSDCVSTGPAPTVRQLGLAHGFSVFNSRIFLDDIDVEALPQFEIVF